MQRRLLRLRPCTRYSTMLSTCFPSWPVCSKKLTLKKPMAILGKVEASPCGPMECGEEMAAAESRNTAYEVGHQMRQVEGYSCASGAVTVQACWLHEVTYFVKAGGSGRALPVPPPPTWPNPAGTANVQAFAPQLRRWWALSATSTCSRRGRARSSPSLGPGSTSPRR